MPNLEDFLVKLDDIPETALADYRFTVDDVSLDYVQNQTPTTRAEFGAVDVALDYLAETVLLRAATATDSHTNTMRI